eukprot:419065-Prymnesium_polylepis.1
MRAHHPRASPARITRAHHPRRSRQGVGAPHDQRRGDEARRVEPSHAVAGHSREPDGRAGARVARGVGEPAGGAR